jgi:sugar/nucleoside kinase (ribokinase family)
MRIVCAGLATVDLIYRVDRIPGVDEKVQAAAVEMAAGGPATNAAVTAAVLGADVTLVSAVGRHPLGEVIRDDLDRYGVRLVDAAAASDAPPPVSSIAVLEGTGERTVVSRNAGDAAVGVPPDLALGDADAVLVDGHHPALAVAAARAGRPLVVDAGSWRPVFAEILPHADLVACSAVFRPPDPGLLSAVPHLAVTAGPDPVRWRSGERSGVVPVPPVDAVDTAGAGDVFHGALAVAVARDPEITDLPGALRYAVRVAGLRVTHRGPRAWRAAVSASGRDRSPAPSSGH